MKIRKDFLRVEGEVCPGVFERLDVNLLFHILSLLDIRSLITLRAVCKSWNATVLSPYFTKLYQMPSSPWVVLRVRTEEPHSRRQILQDGCDNIYDDQDDYTDRYLEFESHTEVWDIRSSKRTICSFPLGPLDTHVFGLTSSNGLVCACLVDELPEALVLVVGNPITNKWKTLPPAPTWDRKMHTDASFFMERDPVTGSYSIVFFGTDSLPGDICHYDSTSESWHSEFIDEPKRGTLLGASVVNMKGAVVNMKGAVFRTRTSKLRQIDAVYPRFTAYDIESRSSSHMSVTWPSQTDKRFFIGSFFYKSKWMWATFIDDGEGLGLGLGIWHMDLNQDRFHYRNVREPLQQLVQSTYKWVAVSMILGNDLFGSSWKLGGDHSELVHWKMKLDVVGSVVVLTSFYGFSSFGLWPAAAYDLEQNKWFTCVTDEDMKKVDMAGNWCCLPYDMESCFALVPSLEAEP